MRKDCLLVVRPDGEYSSASNRVVWKLERSGHYTTRSMYRFISFGGVVDRRCKKLWKNKLPLKLKVFVWQALHNRLPTGVDLKRKKWRGDANCPLCGVPETVDHVLFQCVLAGFVWGCLREVFGWASAPSNLGALLRVFALRPEAFFLCSYLVGVVAD